MNITQIRNATLIIEYAGVKILIDPMLADKDAFPGLPGTVNSHIRMPTVDLPISIKEILDVDAILLTHLHPDHWDETACQAISNDTLIWLQNEKDQATLQQQGFTNTHIFKDGTYFKDITLTSTQCQHGYDMLFDNPAMAERLGEVTGVILSHPEEKTVYLVGDSIWTPQIETTMKTIQPEVVILNAGWAHVLEFGPIIMGKEDVLKTHMLLPNAKIVATHMEAVNHVLLSRAELKDYAEVNQIDSFVSIPEDGENVAF